MLALAALGAAVAMGAAEVTGRESGPRAEDVTSVLQRAEDLLGERATVVGRVGEIISATSFTLTNGGARLLVLNVPVVPAVDDNLDGVLVNEQVEVTGEVRIFSIEEIEAHVGELDEARYQPFLREPVIMADVVTPR